MTKQQQLIHASHMTHAEFYRVNGTITRERVEQMLDELDRLDRTSEGVERAIVHIREARHPFSAEDFLAEVITELAELEKNVRGDNRDKVKALMAKVEDIQMTTFYACEHSDGELSKALLALGAK